MNTHTKRYARECIYCGATPPKLSKEHVIAKSLGGKLTLFEASCKVHADLTSGLERTMGKETYGFVRAMTGVSTRNKDERTKFLNEKVPIKGTNRAGEEVTVEMRRSHTPAMPIALILPPPGLLSGAPPDVDAPIGFNMDTRIAPTEPMAWVQAAPSNSLMVTPFPARNESSTKPQ